MEHYQRQNTIHVPIHNVLQLVSLFFFPFLLTVKFNFIILKEESCAVIILMITAQLKLQYSELG